MSLLTRNIYNLKLLYKLCLCASKSIRINRFKSSIMKFLNVAEKNDAAKNIALHLSRGTSRRREGYSQYNKIYEFEAEVQGQKCDMVMTSVSGHLLSLEFVGTYKHWQSCSPLALFDAPVFKYCPDNYDKIKKTLEREIRGCQGLIIWTDCDREGENIGFEIIEVCTAVKRNITIYRAKFSEITAVSVRRALNNLEQPNKNISDAVDVRQELDLRIGAAFTRFQTLRLQRVFPSKLADCLVSYGSCQFPTLGFVVERYRAVENFVAEPFWKLKVNHTMNNLSVDFAWERVRLFAQDACQVLHDICLENPLATICEVKTKPKSKWRPLPLDTVELEKLASRKLKINAKETMRIAEKLYTQGFISYPRTETNEYPKEMNLSQLVGFQTGDPNWGAFAQGVMNDGPHPRQGNKTDKAHPPIHPTKYTNNLSGNEQRLYEFIVRSFLACCSKDAQGKETTAAITIGGERFTASGLMITERNYLDVYPYDKWSSKEIHLYENGQTFTPTSIEMVAGSTSPPNLLTEADLIALMEKHGIGTDATHAEHIETIKNRSYVALADAHFVPGLLGMGLVDGYDSMGLHISKPHLRAQLEADLKAISEGRKNPQVVLAEQISKYKEVYSTASAQAAKIDAALGVRLREEPRGVGEGQGVGEGLASAGMVSVLKCPKCGSDMALRQKKSNADEYYISCMSYPHCKNAVWFSSIVKTVQPTPDSCDICGPNTKKLTFQWRNNSISHLYPPPYTACIGGCDTAFLDYMQINIASVKRIETRTNNENVAMNRQNSVAPANNPFTAARQNRTNTSNVQQTASGNNNRQNSNPFTMARQNSTNNIANTGRTNNTALTAPQPRANSATNQGQLPYSVVNRVQNPAGSWLPSSSAESSDDSVMCGCNQPAIQLTVRKQNANFGKKFYKCAKGKEGGGCDFFLWAPDAREDTPAQQNASSFNNYTAPPAQQRPPAQQWPPPAQQGSQSDDVSCQCGIPAKRITVQKEGPNKGRPFFGCANDMSSRCSFFQWADSPPATDWGVPSSSNNTNGASGARRGRGAGRGGGGRRRCGLCKQEGHTRNRCPTAPH